MKLPVELPQTVPGSHPFGCVEAGHCAAPRCEGVGMKMKAIVWSLPIIAMMVLGCDDPVDLVHQRGGDIWVMDREGKNAKQITKGILPQWIWTGRTHFAFLVPGANCDGLRTCGGLFVAEWDSDKQAIVGSPTAITPDAKSGENFHWTRDGLWIVFESFRDGNWEIYKVRRDGTQSTNLSKNPKARDFDPDCTHDGPKNGKIAFVSEEAGDQDIWVMDENGGGKINLTAGIGGSGTPGAPGDGGDDWSPAWASDKDTIAFVGSHKFWGNYASMIWLVAASVGHPGPIVSDASTGGADRPAWEGQETIFYVESGDFYKVDRKTKQRTLLARTGMVGGQYALTAKELFVGTSKGIKAIEWNTIDPKTGLPPERTVGDGMNPDL
jgi:Tol biopolymer transport system component